MTHPEPIALTEQGQDKIVAFACGKCRVVASFSSRYVGDQAVELARNEARGHCGPWHCECGRERRPLAYFCKECGDEVQRKVYADRMARRVAKARRVALDDYNVGMVCVDDDVIFKEELFELLNEGEVSGPVWGCYERPLKLDADDIITQALESGEHHEDARDYLEKGAHEALQKALDEWCSKYGRRVSTFFADYGTIVVCDAAEGEDQVVKVKEGA